MKTLADFRNIHKGRSIIVCGLGESVLSLKEKHRRRAATIGVNDIGRYFTPDYLVVINEPMSFTSERWPYISYSRAQYVFTQLDEIALGFANHIQFELGEKRGVSIASDDSLPFASNSPYVALALAAFMGASKIGIIGVDFISHPNIQNVKRLDREYAALRDGLGVEVFNLSAISKLEAFPKISIEDFAK